MNELNATTEVALILHEQSEIISGLEAALKAADEKIFNLQRQVDIFFPTSVPPRPYQEMEQERENVLTAIAARGYVAYTAAIAPIRERVAQAIAEGGGDLDVCDLLIRTQVLHIAQMHRHLDEVTSCMRKAELEAHYYNLLQKACLESEMVMEEWKRFCAVLAMVADDDTPEINKIVRL